jgi:hypothetical protein
VIRLSIEELPKGFELVLKVFGLRIRRFKNIVTDEKVDSRAYDWLGNKPIQLKKERMYPQKENVWTPTSGEVHYQFVFQTHGLEQIIETLKAKTGVNFDSEDFKRDLQKEIKRGTKRVMIITKAWQLCRESCPDNELIFWMSDSFNEEHCVLDGDVESWNARLEKAKSNWRLLK